MRNSGFKILILLGMLIPLNFAQLSGQGASLQGFSLKVSPGALSYYGDLSTNNLNLPARIISGSKFGIGGSIIKQFSPFFGMQAQFIAGSLYTTAADNTYFAGSLTEFSLSARFDPLKLIKKSSLKLSPYISAGVGTFAFRSVRREMYTNVVILPNFGYNVDGITNARKQTAMSLPLAIGLSYKILPNVNLELEHALRLTNTDLLDCFKGPSTANDLYSLTTIGVRYTIRTRSNGKDLSKVSPDAPVQKSIKPSEVTVPTVVKPVFSLECDIPETMPAGQSIDVTVTVTKGKYTGPGKLFQKYPDGFSAIADPAKNYSFSFNNQSVIIEWDKMPADTVVIIGYKVKADANLQGSYSISGRLEHEIQGIKNPYYFNKSIFVDNSRKADDKDVSITQILKQYDSGDAEKTAPARKGNIRKSEPLTGIEFRVQCGAFRDKNMADTHLAEKYKITEIIQEEFTDGWYKYTVGSFRTYEEATRYRDTFIAKTRILSSFIVAYKDGRRLSNINEALR